MSQIPSFNCKKYGHYKYQCKSQKGEGKAQHAKAAVTIDSDDELEKALLLTCDVAVEDQKNICFLDTGCSNHMCGQKELFSSLDETLRSEVKFGNSCIVPVMGKGHIHINARDGSGRRIADVYYVPGLHQNLLSMGYSHKQARGSMAPRA